MILKWGAHAHEQDEAGVKIEYRSIFDKHGRRMGEIQEWHIVGAVIGTSQANLTTKLATLETAYQTDYKDLGLYLNDGATLTRHAMLNADMFGGTHVTFFGYVEGPWKMGLEYANRRTFYIVIRGEVRTGTGQYAWKERLKTKGTGNKKWRYMPSMNADPEPQDLQPSTPFYYIQQGMAIGRQSHILPPGPIFPGIEHEEERVIDYETPEDIRVGGNELFTTRWLYVMEATQANPFVCFNLPNVL